MKQNENEILNRKYFDADKAIIEDLERHFAPRSLVKKTADGDSIDDSATLVACGAYEVISYFKQRIALGEKAQ